MIAALFALLFLGGEGSPLLQYVDVYRDRIKTEIVDEDRRGEAMEVLESIEDATKDLGEKINDYGDQLGEILEERNTTDADAIWNQYFQDVLVYHSLVLDQRDEMKTHVNRDEWSVVFAADIATSEF